MFGRDEPLSSAVRRVGAEQLTAAIDALDRGLTDDVEEAVHDVRKRTKKVRGLVRLVRPTIGKDTYRWVNRSLRDAASELSDARDATVLLATFEQLHAPPAGDGDRVLSLRATLERQRAQRALAIDRDDERVVRARAMLVEVRDHASSWSFADDGWAALEGGLTRTYDRGRDGAHRARETSSPADLHEWRKRAKYTMYHLRLLAGSSPSIVGGLAEGFHGLSALLGDLHDRDVLADALRGNGELAVDEGAGADDADTLGRIEVERADLERRAIALGGRLYAESARRFGDRIGSYWACWEELGDEPRSTA